MSISTTELTSDSNASEVNTEDLDPRIQVINYYLAKDFLSISLLLFVVVVVFRKN